MCILDKYKNITVYIGARAQTPNPRPRPPKGSDTIVYVVEQVERKEPEQKKSRTIITKISYNIR